MLFQLHLLLASLEKHGGISDYYCTVWILEDELKDYISDKFLNDRIEIKTYKPDIKLNLPFNYNARLDLYPKSDLVICVDCDVIFLEDISEFLKYCQDAGTLLAAGSRHKALGLFAETEWKSIYEQLGIAEFPGRYYHDKKGEKVLTDGPFYFNNSLVVMPGDFCREASKVVGGIRKKLFDIKGNFRVFSQVLASVLPPYLGLTCERIPARFRECYFHYAAFAWHLNCFRILKKMKPGTLKDKFMELEGMFGWMPGRKFKKMI